MSQNEIVFHRVHFSYPDSAAVLLEDVDCHFSHGWNGIVGANGAGKTTLIQLALGTLRPQSGGVQAAGKALYCPQRTDEPPAGLEALQVSADGEACRLRGRLDVGADWLERWDTLSHGERKRAQIAVALWHQPDVLAVDEPTNHLDAPARRMLEEALVSYGGVGLLVSHDRDLLDRLCRQCLFIEPPRAVLRPGGFSCGVAEREREEETARREFAAASSQRQRLEREAVRRREEAARQQKRRSKRGLGKDNDARFKRNRARVSGKDGTAGRQLRQLDGRLESARRRQAEAQFRSRPELGIWLGGGRPRRDWLFRLPPGSESLGGRRRLSHEGLAMRPQERVAMTGANGSGKSTLLRRIVGAVDLGPGRLLYVPQEIAADEAADLLRRIRALERASLGRVMTAVSCLGSCPERLLASDNPSPGETRKLLLALGIMREPHLVVLDEPTNHLDLPSIECLEEALDACPCGLLLVSHDARFLERLCQTRWQLQACGADTALHEEPMAAQSGG